MSFFKSKLIHDKNIKSYLTQAEKLFRAILDPDGKGFSKFDNDENVVGGPRTHIPDTT